jgi:hypothetical protein
VCKRTVVTRTLLGASPATQDTNANGPPPVAYLVDTSTNGTYLNGKKVERNTRTALRNSDVLALANPDLNYDKARARARRRAPAAPPRPRCVRPGGRLTRGRP